MTRKLFLGLYSVLSLQKFQSEQMVCAPGGQSGESAPYRFVSVETGTHARPYKLPLLNLRKPINIAGRVFVQAMRKLVLAAALLSLSAQAHAAAGWTSSLTIQSFIPTDGGLSLIVSGNDNPMGCPSPTWIHLHLTDPNYDLISSTLLTAYAQGKTVKVWEGGCETDGSVHFWAVWVGP